MEIFNLTVKELIEKLQELPQDYEVRVNMRYFDDDYTSRWQIAKNGRHLFNKISVNNDRKTVTVNVSQ